MKKLGRTIKLFLLDGEPDGRMICELSNWTGKAFKIPRIKLKESADRQELASTGIYILFGESDGFSRKGQAYIGESEKVYKRLTQHLGLKKFWTEAIVIVSKDKNLNKAHIKYLESRLYEIARGVNRYELTNTQTPVRPSISESDQAEIEVFMGHILLIINTLGYKIFEEIRNTEEQGEVNTFFIKAARGAEAKGQITNEGFAVLKGSAVANPPVNSFSKSWEKLRNELIDNRVIIAAKDKMVFNEDYLFSSPSSAASIVMGRSANGLIEWKLTDGRSLKSVE